MRENHVRVGLLLCTVLLLVVAQAATAAGPATPRVHAGGEILEGAFDAPLLGGYPTEMTEHVFRSLSQTMGAAIHLEVKGENDHHKTEACFKAFGRAMRQALRVDGEAIPSSKGVL